ncbi:MAG TPA: TMEM175 family protein [Ferruginibacter sp.]|nr:TMEM175 family protein [Ferruginibacter sp.]
MNQLHNELKKEFQIERMILFSDAVFAIAITLLIIEIKVPELDKSSVSDKLLGQELAHLIPRFAGFIISFLIIGLYWTVHHRIFAYVDHYNSKLLWLNLFFLFSIVLMAFSSGFYGEYANRIDLLYPYGFYCFNVCITGVLNFLLWRYISSKKSGISNQHITTERRNYGSFRSLVVPFAFFISFIVCFWNPFISRYMPILIPIMMRIAKTYYKKKDPTLKY